MLTSMGCDPEGPLFIEPASRGETALILVPPEGSQGADPERLDAVAGEVGLGGDMDAVRYRLTEHHQAFLLTGDLSEGIRDLTSLQLPVPLGEPAEQLIRELPPLRPWQSLRVYDGGTCGVRVPWVADDEGELLPAFVPLLFESIANQLEANRRVRGVALADARIQPVLRSLMPRSALVSPTTRDRLELSFEIQADYIGTKRQRAVGCDNVRMHVDTTLELVPTDLAWVAVPKKGFPRACFGESMSERELRAALAEGRRCAPDAVVELPEPYGAVRGSDIGDLQWLAAWTRRNHSQVLVGLRSLESAALDAHDVLVRTLSSEVTNLRTDRCRNFARDEVRRRVRKGLAEGFVTGLSAAFRDALTWDPAHLPGFRPHAGIEVPCETDGDCRDAFGGAGLRHRCMVRSRERYPSLLQFPVPSRDTSRICHFVSEPDRVNVRPDGVQVAIIRAGDPQEGAYRGPDAPLGGLFCNPSFEDLSGAHVFADERPPPREHTPTTPFSLDYVPSTVAPTRSSGCSAAGGRPPDLVALLLLALVRRRVRR